MIVNTSGDERSRSVLLIGLRTGRYGIRFSVDHEGRASSACTLVSRARILVQVTERALMTSILVPEECIGRRGLISQRENVSRARQLTTLLERPFSMQGRERWTQMRK